MNLILVFVYFLKTNTSLSLLLGPVEDQFLVSITQVYINIGLVLTFDTLI
jgi:hypothetical protein